MWTAFEKAAKIILDWLRLESPVEDVAPPTAPPSNIATNDPWAGLLIAEAVSNSPTPGPLIDLESPAGRKQTQQLTPPS